MNVNALFTSLGTCFFHGIFFHIVHDKNKFVYDYNYKYNYQSKNCETHTTKNNYNQDQLNRENNIHIYPLVDVK